MRNEMRLGDEGDSRLPRSGHDHEDDEVRYDEMEPNPDVRIIDWPVQQQKNFAQFQSQSDLAQKITATARLMPRRTRESIKVELVLELCPEYDKAITALNCPRTF